MIGRILPFTAVIVPFWLVRTMVNWRATFEVLPAILVVGVSFALTQFFWSNYVDSNLVDIMGGVVSIGAAVVFLRFWKPKKIWRFLFDQQANLPSPLPPGPPHSHGRSAPRNRRAGGRAQTPPPPRAVEAWE